MILVIPPHCTYLNAGDTAELSSVGKNPSYPGHWCSADSSRQRRGYQSISMLPTSEGQVDLLHPYSERKAGNTLSSLSSGNSEFPGDTAADCPETQDTRGLADVSKEQACLPLWFLFGNAWSTYPQNKCSLCSCPSVVPSAEWHDLLERSCQWQHWHLQSTEKETGQSPQQLVLQDNTDVALSLFHWNICSNFMQQSLS